MGRTALIINPHSANGSTAREVDTITARARAVLGEVEVRQTQAMGHATQLTAEVLDAGCDCVIAVGGDGTNNEVVNGFFKDDGTPRAPNARFGFLPRGTGGDFRRSFGLGKELEAALERAKGPGSPTDAGMVEFTAHDGTRKHRAFINIASAGLSGTVDKMVNSTSKALGPAAFFVGSLKGLIAFHPHDMTVKVDGQVFHQGMAALCTAANGKFFGGGMQVAPGAEVDDGLLEVVCLPGWGSLRFVAESLKLYAGDIRKAAGVKVTRGKRVEMESPEEVLMDIDGEQPGRLPAVFTIREKMLRVCR
ncbi:MAG: diacylglycerol kinase family lipid kinase [Deltaproteobacteria bacterium]|nr:diacylglycerol kinase family lipid kinase [Deltaproteobacteria bacterium]